jgi:flagellar protein FliS
MTYSIYNKYLENEVLSADPLKLVVILYRTALEAVGQARRHLAAGAIRDRSLQITRAQEMIGELLRTLDFAKGGEIARSLAELYAYLLTRLTQANATQTDAPLAEVGALLTTLLEAWRAAVPAPAAAAAPVVAHDYEPISCTA